VISLGRPRSSRTSARALALDVLLALERGREHSNALLADLPASMDERDRALATEIVYGVLRRRSELDGIIAAVSSRPLPAIDSVVLQAVRMALYQVLHLDRVPRAAAVDEAVRLIRTRRGRPAAAFGNAVLRAACRETEGRRPPAAEHGSGGPVTAKALARKHSFPVFLVERCLRAFGAAECDALLDVMNRPAPTALRPSRRAGGAPALIARLAQEGIEAIESPVVRGAVRVPRGAPQRTAAFREGLFYIQDEASQIVVCLLEPIHPGTTVLDLCAAPGGKLLAVLDRPEPTTGLRLACDTSAARLDLLRQNLRRLRLPSPPLLVMDAARPALRARFDRILLDAPCSGTGIIRRHPEIRWRRTPEQIAGFAARQAAALDAAAGLTAAGGRLVYAVCSLEPEEGPERIAALLGTRPDLRVVDARGLLPPELRRLVTAEGFLKTLPHRDDLDGFFAAVLETR
jgi:16S rRNA (cytosine967-C5)-methyltransferase